MLIILSSFLKSGGLLTGISKAWLGMNNVPKEISLISNNTESSNVKFKFGIYNGTGTYGANNPIIIDIGFKPTLFSLLKTSYYEASNPLGIYSIELYDSNSVDRAASGTGWFDFSTVTNAYSNTVGFYYKYYNTYNSGRVYTKYDNNKLYWYSSDDATYQFNDSKTRYYWMALA